MTQMHKALQGIKDPAQIFDLVCAQNWFAGNLNQNIPVEQSRAAFKEMERLIKISVLKPYANHNVSDEVAEMIEMEVKSLKRKRPLTTT